MSDNNGKLTIIGGGLAGCEAAWQAARLGLEVTLHEMKPVRRSPAHHLDTLSELVCSNSLKAENPENASGLLKEEMRLMGSVILEAAGKSRVPAGGTLAVDREKFSALVTDMVKGAGVEVVRGEVTEVPSERPLVVATGPLTTDALADSLAKFLGGDRRLFFFDAVAPIVHGDSVDMTKAFFASRWGKGGADYLNCPMNEEEYNSFIDELTAADRAEERDFEKDVPYFEGCMPIEELASRGRMTPAFGPMRPVGLTDPRTGQRPFAVVQLRRENAEGTLYNMVGFQTRLRYPEQKRVLRMIPGLEGAEFARLGKIHRNTYVDSPRVLRGTMELRTVPGAFLAGQITGVEGYCESAVSGMVAGMNAARFVSEEPGVMPPRETVTGALVRYVTDPKLEELQPMNANFGLLPPVESTDGKKVRKKDRKRLASERALEEMSRWIKDNLETPM